MVPLDKLEVVDVVDSSLDLVLPADVGAMLTSGMGVLEGVLEEGGGCARVCVPKVETEPSFPSSFRSPTNSIALLPKSASLPSLLNFFLECHILVSIKQLLEHIVGIARHSLCLGVILHRFSFEDCIHVKEAFDVVFSVKMSQPRIQSSDKHRRFSHVLGVK